MKRSIIITTINQPNEVIKRISEESKKNSILFIIVGDKKTPTDFHVGNGIYLDLDTQYSRFPQISKILPLNHYSRKNIGYLYAIKNNVDLIQETDDDNMPLDSFFGLPNRKCKELFSSSKWVNVYNYFADAPIWPRGYPLEFINDITSFDIRTPSLEPKIFQGLADKNPDVDAIYRMTRSLPINFLNKDSILLAKNVWCPFNSQNTIFNKEAFPLLYLPSFCTFRMTDIWRSLVAQRCLWEIGAGVCYHSSTVYQNRNEHSLLKDFEDEIPGYLLNEKIRNILEYSTLTGNPLDDLVLCYEKLIKHEILPQKEMDLVKIWVDELEKLL